MTYTIKANEGGEIRCLQRVNNVDELRTINSIVGGENTAWKDAYLQKLCDRFAFCSL